MCPRRGTFFSCVAKKRRQKKATPSLRPLRDAKGQTCARAVAGCAVELALRCARRSDSHGESVHEAWALRRPCSPRNRPAAGAASRGGTAETSEQPHGPLLRSAPVVPRVALAPACARPSAAMARGVVRLRVPFCACREAQGRGCVRVPQDTRTSCTDSPQLFERSAPARSEFCGAPPDRASQVARSAAKGHAQQGRFLFGDFLLARQEKVTAPPGAHPGSRP